MAAWNRMVPEHPRRYSGTNSASMDTAGGTSNWQPMPKRLEGAKPEARVVRRVAADRDCAVAGLAAGLEPSVHQRAADALPLVRWRVGTQVAAAVSAQIATAVSARRTFEARRNASGTVVVLPSESNGCGRPGGPFGAACSCRCGRGLVMRRVMVRFLLAVGVPAVGALALAGAPAQFEAVERFAARLSEGNVLQLRTLLPTEVVLTEHDLSLRSAVGPAAHARLPELVAEGARLEVSFEFASVDRSVIVTRERMWLDDMPESLVPLRSTGVYLVDGGRVLSITRVLDADQHDVLMREAIVGDWAYGVYILSFHADGTYELVSFARPYHTTYASRVTE